jgi:hypothetical protein
LVSGAVESPRDDEDDDDEADEDEGVEDMSLEFSFNKIGMRDERYKLKG